ncbi:hypothetical protein EV363DRAFT_1350874 [Boletus edulis]|nr:hypothetical protein EV363DRAFT_1350874 [Boletus edulis]
MDAMRWLVKSMMRSSWPACPFVCFWADTIYNPKGPTPAVSVDQSPRRSFEEAVQKLEHLLQQPSITPAQLRKLLLFRDNNRCVFTDALCTSERPRPVTPGIRFDVINVVHVISQSLPAGIHHTTERVQEKFEWARTTGAMIERFGDFSSYDVLRDEILNSPTNAFLSSPAAHEAFNQLDMWLTPAKVLRF